MKDFDVEKIVAGVHSAVGDLDVHGLVDDVHQAVMGAKTKSKHAAPGEEIEKEFQVGVRPELSVSSLHGGHISIRAAADPVIRIRAAGHKNRGSSSVLDEFPFDVSHDGSSVQLRPRGRWRGSSVDYRIEVPRDCAVRVHGINPDVEVQGTAAPVEIETVGGEINVEDVSGPCGITTVSGEIHGRSIDGTLTVHTTSGDVEILQSRLQRFTLHSVSGDFTIETPLTVGERYLVNTTSGDLRLLVSGSTGATVEMKSFSGDVVSELPTEVIKTGRRIWQGRINGGGAFLEMTSMSGDLHVERGAEFASDAARSDQAATPAADAPTASPMPETDESRQDETSRVLGALERGEITVEEAMARLDEQG